MLSLLYVLIRIYQALEIGIGGTNQQLNFLFRGPFQLYLGWISVATIANFSAFLISIGVVMTIGTQQVAALVLMIVVLYIAYRMRKDRYDVIYPLVIAWALIGIGAKYLNDERLGVWIAFPAFIIAGIILLLAIVLPSNKLKVETEVSD